MDYGIENLPYYLKASKVRGGWWRPGPLRNFVEKLGFEKFCEKFDKIMDSIGEEYDNFVELLGDNKKYKTYANLMKSKAITVKITKKTEDTYEIVWKKDGKEKGRNQWFA